MIFERTLTYSLHLLQDGCTCGIQYPPKSAKSSHPCSQAMQGQQVLGQVVASSKEATLVSSYCWECAITSGFSISILCPATVVNGHQVLALGQRSKTCSLSRTCCKQAVHWQNFGRLAGRRRDQGLKLWKNKKGQVYLRDISYTILLLYGI